MRIQNQGVLSLNLQELRNIIGKALGIYNQIPQHNIVLSSDIKNTLIDIRRVSEEFKAILNKMN